MKDYDISTHNDCGELDQWLELQGDKQRAKQGEDSGSGKPIDAAGTDNSFLQHDAARAKLRTLVPIVPNPTEDGEDAED